MNMCAYIQVLGPLEFKKKIETKSKIYPWKYNQQWVIIYWLILLYHLWFLKESKISEHNIEFSKKISIVLKGIKLHPNNMAEK